MFGIAIFGRHIPVIDWAWNPRFFQFSKSAEEYMRGVSSFQSKSARCYLQGICGSRTATGAVTNPVKGVVSLNDSPAMSINSFAVSIIPNGTGTNPGGSKY